MNDTAILLPVMTLVGWTFVVLMNVPIRRFRAVGKREVSPRDFSYGESERVPGVVSLPNRNFMNLLEVPVLFYVVCLVQYVTATPVTFFTGLAWLFVVARVVHSLIHLTYNKVTHRLAAFAVSNLVVLAMWLMLLINMH